MGHQAVSRDVGVVLFKPHLVECYQSVDQMHSCSQSVAKVKVRYRSEFPKCCLCYQSVNVVPLVCGERSMTTMTQCFLIGIPQGPKSLQVPPTKILVSEGNVCWPNSKGLGVSWCTRKNQAGISRGIRNLSPQNNLGYKLTRLALTWKHTDNNAFFFAGGDLDQFQFLTF